MRGFIRTGLGNWRVSREHSSDLANLENATCSVEVDCLTWSMSERGRKKRGENPKGGRHGIRGEEAEHTLRVCGVALRRQKWLRNLHSDLLHFMHRNVRYSIKCSARGKTTTVRILVRIANFHDDGLIIYLRCTTCLLLAFRQLTMKGRERRGEGAREN